MFIIVIMFNRIIKNAEDVTAPSMPIFWIKK